MRAAGPRKPTSRTARAVAAPASAGGAADYELRLYVSGATARSLRAIANVSAICERHLEGRYRLEIVDIYLHPAELRVDQILAVPTLVRRLPVPLRLLVGDLSRTEQVLRGLGLDAPAS